MTMHYTSKQTSPAFRVLADSSNEMLRRRRSVRRLETKGCVAICSESKKVLVKSDLYLLEHNKYLRRYAIQIVRPNQARCNLDFVQRDYRYKQQALSSLNYIYRMNFNSYR